MSTLRRIDPLGGDPRDLDLWRQSWRVWNAGSRRQYGPEASQIDADTLLEHRRRTGDAFAHLVISERDVVVGRIDLVTNPREEPGLVHAQFDVMPPWRKQGFGQQMWDAARPILDELGATAVEAITAERVDGSHPNSGGIHMLERDGFRPVLTSLSGELRIHEFLPEFKAAPGYRLEVHTDVPDDDAIAGLAPLHRALDEARHAGRPPMHRWTRETLKAGFERSTDLGLRHITVAVVDETSGEPVGYSEQSWAPTNRQVVHSVGTYVLPDHRDRGLAKAAKGRAIREIVAIADGAALVWTQCAEDNHQMRAVNARLGFTATHRQTEWRQER